MLGKRAVIIAVLGVIISIFIYCKTSTQERPPLPQEKWWGYGSRTSDEDTSVRPFTVNVSEEVLVDLQARLAKTRLGTDLEDGTFEYGFQVRFMEELIEHWRNKYDWRKHEAIINSFPQYKTAIDGLDLYFTHVKPSKKASKVYPMLMVHGWPSSVWDFHKLLPLLTEPDENGVAFEVVCPSIPGYTFSEQPHKKGFDSVAAAVIFKTLMLRLGYDRFYLQGSDFGSTVINMMSAIYPQHVIGIHTHMPIPQFNLKTLWRQLVISVWPSALITDKEMEHWRGFRYIIKLFIVEMGYAHLQGTRPDTIAFALNDSPVGLAAYMLEKVAAATHETFKYKVDGGIPEFFSLDDVVTCVMIYWVSGCMGSSMRLYKEYSASEDVPLWESVQISVPAGITTFRNEPVVYPLALVDSRFTELVHHSVLPRGGHFGALEEPKLLADDVRQFVNKVQARHHEKANE